MCYLPPFDLHAFAHVAQAHVTAMRMTTRTKAASCLWHGNQEDTHTHRKKRKILIWRRWEEEIPASCEYQSESAGERKCETRRGNSRTSLAWNVTDVQCAMALLRMLSACVRKPAFESFVHVIFQPHIYCSIELQPVANIQYSWSMHYIRELILCRTDSYALDTDIVKDRIACRQCSCIFVFVRHVR
jgi:hypothetical protein